MFIIVYLIHCLPKPAGWCSLVQKVWEVLFKIAGLPESTSPRLPPFCSTARLAPPMVAYSGPQTAIALSVPMRKGW